MVFIDINRSIEFYVFLSMWLFFILWPTSIFISAFSDYLKFNGSDIIPINTKIALLKKQRKSIGHGEDSKEYILYTLKLDYMINGKTYEEIMKHSQTNELDKAVKEGEMIIYCNPKKPKKYWTTSYYNHYKRPSSLIAPIIIALLFWSIPAYALYTYLMQSWL